MIKKGKSHVKRNEKSPFECIKWNEYVNFKGTHLFFFLLIDYVLYIHDY